MWSAKRSQYDRKLELIQLDTYGMFDVYSIRQHILGIFNLNICEVLDFCCIKFKP